MDVVLHGLKDSTPPEGVGLNWSTAHQAGKLIEDGNLKKDTFSLSTTARTRPNPVLLGQSKVVFSIRSAATRRISEERADDEEHLLDVRRCVRVNRTRYGITGVMEMSMQSIRP